MSESKWKRCGDQCMACTNICMRCTKRETTHMGGGFCACCKNDGCAYGSQVILLLATIVSLVFSVFSATGCEFVEIVETQNATFYAGLYNYQNSFGSCTSIPSRVDFDPAAKAARSFGIIAPCFGIVLIVIIILSFFVKIPPFIARCVYGWLFVMAIVSQGLTFLVFDSQTYCQGTLLDIRDESYTCDPGPRVGVPVLALILYAVSGLIALCTPQPKVPMLMMCIKSVQEHRQHDKDEKEAAAAAASAGAAGQKTHDEEGGNLTITTNDPEHTTIDYHTNDDGTVTIMFGVKKPVPEEGAAAAPATPAPAPAPAAVAAVDTEGREAEWSEEEGKQDFVEQEPSTVSGDDPAIIAENRGTSTTFGGDGASTEQHVAGKQPAKGGNWNPKNWHM